MRIFELQRGKYRPLGSGYLEEVELGLKLWDGLFEGHTDTWLRWCDRDGKLIPTFEERAQKLQHRAEDAERQAKQSALRIRELEETLLRLQSGSGKIS